MRPAADYETPALAHRAWEQRMAAEAYRQIAYAPSPRIAAARQQEAAGWYALARGEE